MKSPSLIRGRVNLGREIAVVLMIKLAILYAIWNAFFSEPLAKHMLVPQGQIERQFMVPDSSVSEAKTLYPQMNTEAHDGTP